MKFSKYFMMAGAAALLAACSSEAPIDNGSNANENGDAKSYINVSIKLPTETATRADSSNDQFDDGKAEEYEVKTAHLVIFQREGNENDATVVGTYDLSNDVDQALKDHRTYVTGYFNLITAINNAPSDKLYALVILNMSTPEVDAMCKVNETKMSELVNTPVDGARYTNTTNGFVMMNAPVYDTTSPTKTTTFKHIDKAQMYKTAELAQSSPNSTFDVYVERVVSKATLTVSANDANKKLTVGSTVLTIGDVTWNLDVTNTKTYRVRNVTDFGSWPIAYTDNGNNPNRFFSTASNRIYWAKDPNYTTAENSDLNVFSRLDMKNVTKTTNDVVYCLENTFDVKNQIQNRTTRMVLKAQLKSSDGNNAKDFYTIGSIAGIFDKDQAVAQVKTVITNNKLSWKDGETTVSMTDADKITVTLNETAGSHTFKVGDIKYQQGDNSYTAPENVVKQLNSRLVAINTYKNGQCYYIVRLKHFGDKYCLWTPEVDDTYGDEPDASNRFLGRYGMVRNNWYEVNVNKFTYLGLPEIPDPSDDPDDVNESYINYRININAWAKRVQNVEL